jgi:hypothetical protein
VLPTQDRAACPVLSNLEKIRVGDGCRVKIIRHRCSIARNDTFSKAVAPRDIEKIFRHSARKKKNFRHTSVKKLRSYIMVLGTLLRCWDGVPG